MSNWSKILLEYLSNNYEQTKENIENTTELTLDGYYIGAIPLDIKNYLQKFNHIEHLNMSFCKLHSLDNLPILPNVTKVELNDNLLNEKEFIKLKKYPLLSEIFFANNKVKDIELMKEMSSMRDIHLIDLSENPICSTKDYRKNIFAFFQICDANVVTEEDVKIHKYLARKFANCYIVLNKTDKQPIKIYLSKLDKIAKYLNIDKEHIIFVSAKKNENIDVLRQTIKNLLNF